MAKSKEFNMRTDMLTNVDLSELASHVENGNTGGRLDSETEDGKSKYIYWELKVNVWED